MRFPVSAQKTIYAATFALVVYLVAGPLVILIVTAFRDTRDALPFEPQAAWTIGNFVELFRDPILYRSVMPTTLVYTCAAVLFASCLSVAFAWLIERTDVPFPNALFVLVISPLIIPTVVKAIAWSFVLGPNAGLVNVELRRLFGLSAPGPFDIHTLAGLVLVQGLELVPLGVILMTAAFRSVDPSLEEVSYTSGARPVATFRRITLGVLRPATLSLIIVLTTLTLEMVEVPLAIGTPGNVQVFSSWMFFAMNPAGVLPDYGRLAASVLPVFVLGFVLLGLYHRTTRIAGRYATVTGKAYRGRRHTIGRWRSVGLIATLAYVALTLIGPAVVMLVMSLFPEAGRSAAGVLGPLSFESYAEVFADPVTGAAFRNTFMAGSIGATIAVVLAALAAWFIVRTKAPGRRLLDFLCFAPITIPVIVMGFAIGLVYLYLPIPIYGTVWILAVAYAGRMAVASRTLQASMTQIHRELEDASAVAGASWATTLWRIIVPLVRPAAIASWLLLVIVCFREFTVGMILYRPANVVVGVHLWNLYARGRAAEASALGFVMILIVFVAAFLGRRVLMPDVSKA